MPTVRVINEANPFSLVYTKNSLSLQSLNNLSLILSKQDNVSVVIIPVLVFVVIQSPETLRNVQSQKRYDQHESGSNHRCVPSSFTALS
jgi:hypothetical protein